MFLAFASVFTRIPATCVCVRVAYSTCSCCCFGAQSEFSSAIPTTPIRTVFRMCASGNYDIRRCKFYSMMSTGMRECGPTHSRFEFRWPLARWRRKKQRYDILLCATIYYFQGVQAMNWWRQARCFRCALFFLFCSFCSHEFWSMRSISKFLRFIFLPLILYFVNFVVAETAARTEQSWWIRRWRQWRYRTFTLIAVSLLLGNKRYAGVKTAAAGKRYVISTSCNGHWPANDGTTFGAAEAVTFFTLHSVWYTFSRHRTFMPWLMFVVCYARRNEFIIATRIQSMATFQKKERRRKASRYSTMTIHLFGNGKGEHFEVEDFRTHFYSDYFGIAANIWHSVHYHIASRRSFCFGWAAGEKKSRNVENET